MNKNSPVFRVWGVCLPVVMVVVFVSCTAVLVDDIDAIFGSHVDGNVGHFM